MQRWGLVSLIWRIQRGTGRTRKNRHYFYHLNTSFSLPDFNIWPENNTLKRVLALCAAGKIKLKVSGGLSLLDCQKSSEPLFLSRLSDDASSKWWEIWYPYTAQKSKGRLECVECSKHSALTTRDVGWLSCYPYLNVTISCALRRKNMVFHLYTSFLFCFVLFYFYSQRRFIPKEWQQVQNRCMDSVTHQTWACRRTMDAVFSSKICFCFP